MKNNDINSKLRLALKIMGGVIVFLLITLIVVLVTKQPEDDPIQTNGENNGKAEIEEKTTILNIPSLDEKGAFEILDLLVEKYGEPNPEGLIDILKEQEETTFQTVTWENIKYGYDLAFNFWTDDSLARKDSFYFTGHKGEDNTIAELYKLLNLEENDSKFVFNVTDYGGAVFNVGITPAKVARTPEPVVEEEIEDLPREEVLTILEENAQEKHPNDQAKAKLEYQNQEEAYNWVTSRSVDPDLIGIDPEKYPDIMESARREWGHNYIMVKWQYEKDVRAYEATQ